MKILLRIISTKAFSFIELPLSLLILLTVLLLTAPAYGQTDINALNPRHSAALESFLAGNQNYAFMAETEVNEETLTEMRELMNGNTTPYYKVGDFNKDGIGDFALVLLRPGAKQRQPGVTSEAHQYTYPLTIAIFNGLKDGGFKNVFMKNIREPLVCYLSVSADKRKTLSLRVYQTDSNYIIKYVGGRYIVAQEESD